MYGGGLSERDFIYMNYLVRDIMRALSRPIPDSRSAVWDISLHMQVSYEAINIVFDSEDFRRRAGVL